MTDKNIFVVVSMLIIFLVILASCTLMYNDAIRPRDKWVAEQIGIPVEKLIFENGSYKIKNNIDVDLKNLKEAI
jgi:hypothetical protein